MSQRTASANPYWSGKKVLVTGGAGFIGSHLVERLVRMKCSVRVADNLVRGRLENLSTVQKQIEFMQCDLTIKENCLRACEGQDIVFHLASKVGGIGYYMQKPGEVFTNNILMDTEMSVAARQCGVSRYLFSSSAHVYPKSLQTREDSPALKEPDASPADPAISYGWGKLISEKMLQFQNIEDKSMRTAIVRIVGAFGERQDIDLATSSAIPAFCRRAVEFPARSPFTMMGEGKETRSYCYVGDVVTGMVLCIEGLELLQEIGPLNLGTEGRISIGELAREVIRISGKDIAIQTVEAPESGIRGQAVDLSLTKKVLGGWKPEVSLSEGLRRTYSDIEQRLNAGEGGS
jgi:nucleoside-diphosphate-sugar epimerase